MSDPSHNAPAVFRRVILFILAAVFCVLGAKVRGAYAINPLPVLAEPKNETTASYEGPETPPFLDSGVSDASQASTQDLPFPSFKMPFPAGTGFVPKDGGYSNGLLHLRGDFDQFAIDICEGDSCQYGQHVIAPTNISYDSSSPWSTGYHFFEVYDDGSEKLCMSLGHFDWPLSIFPSGSPEPGTSFPQGAVLGEVSWWGQMPHIHIGIWKMASKTRYGYPVRCHQSIVPRYPQPFTGIYQLDGMDLEECWPNWYSCYNVHAERHLVSSNAAYSYLEAKNPDLLLAAVQKEESEKEVWEPIALKKARESDKVLPQTQPTIAAILPVISHS
jgi:hypothetical protein